MAALATAPVAAGNRTCAGASTSYAQAPQRRCSGASRPSSAQQQQRRALIASSGVRSSRRAATARRAAAAAASASFGGGEIVEVKDLKGIRVLKNEDDSPRVEYLVEWKDGSPDTWEPAGNLADNLLRDYEQRWWGAIKKGDEETANRMMEVGGDVLARTVDENRRSALHFAAALGKADLVTRLLKAGGEVDLADKEGFTSLHMAAGYMHTSTIAALLAGGADPEQQDRQGRSPLELVESLRAALPATNPNVVQRRMALENVIQMLMANMFEDVEPAAVLGKRVVSDAPEEEAAADAAADAKKEGEGLEGGDDAAAAAAAKAEGGEEAKKAAEEGKEAKEAEAKEAEAAAKGPQRTEWLVKFEDEDEPVWVDARYVSPEVAEDYEQGLEYAQAEAVVGMRQRGTMRSYLVRWRDDYPDTWEPEEHVSADLVALWERQQDKSDDSDANGGAPCSSSGNGAAAAAGGGNGSGNGAAAGMQQLQGSAA